MSTQTPTVPARARAERFALDPEATSATFRARGFAGLPVRGHFGARVKGEIVVGDGRLSAAGEVAASEVSTGIARRDAHLRSPDFLAADEHPVIALRVDEAPFPLEEATVAALVTIRGITRPVALQVTLALEAGALCGHARGRLNRRDFAVVPPAFLDRVVIRPEVEVEVDLVARRRG